MANPASGGAGRTTHELCRRWVKQGHQVTVFTSNFPKGRDHETIEGYDVVRRGSLLTHYYFARQYYKAFFRGKFDVVIDQINTIPYFTPWYVRDAAIVVYIHQLCREIWFYEAVFPFSLAGNLSEPFFLKLYRNYPVVTVSESTRQDLRGLGFSNLRIVPNAIDFVPLAKPTLKEPVPTIIFVGRLKKAKRPHHVIEALSLVHKHIPELRLWVVGDGDYRGALEALVRKHKVQERVTFFGWLTLQAKRDLMERAHCICVPSIREGWGLIVTEANALGTPAIVYKVPGLRDSVSEDINGFFTEKNTPDSLADALKRFFGDPGLRDGLYTGALEHSRKFDWDLSASAFAGLLEAECDRFKRIHHEG